MSRIVVISSDTYSLFNFRLDMMKAMIDQGHSVIAYGTEDESDWTESFKEHDIHYRSYFLERNNTNPQKDYKSFRHLKSLIKEDNPDLVFTYFAKAITYGNVAAKAVNVKNIYSMVTGLGSILRSKSIKHTLVKLVLKLLYRFAFKASDKVFVQNHDDRDWLIKAGVLNPDKAVLINGSGVNTERFKPEEIPLKPVLLFVGRLLRDKGVMEYLQACRMVKSRHPHVRCLLIGPYDTNPTSLKPEDIKPYIDDGTVEYLGLINDVRPYLKICTTFVLPSYHEGTSRATLEAMATGRAIITTDAPGCRETVIDNENGFLVPVRNSQKLAEKMCVLVEKPELNKAFGEKSLEIVREKFDVNIVNHVLLSEMNLIR